MPAVSMSQSHRPWYGVLEDKLARYNGSWAIGATGAVGTKTGGRGLTLARTGVGTYTIQMSGSKGLAARVFSLLCLDYDVEMADTHAYQLRTISAVAATGLITIKNFTDGAIAELPTGAVVRIGVTAKLSSSIR